MSSEYREVQIKADEFARDYNRFFLTNYRGEISRQSPIKYSDFGRFYASSAKYGLLQEGVALLPEVFRERDVVFNDRTVLDLGSGTGQMVAYFVEEWGMKASGIELEVYSVLRANQVFEEMGIANKAHIYWGNAFHPNFEVPEKIEWGSGHVRTKEQIRDALKELADLVYERTPPLNSFDFYYMYQYFDNTFPLVKMLSQMGKPGAYIICGGPSHLEESLKEHDTYLPKNIELVYRSDWLSLLQIRSLE